MIQRSLSLKYEPLSEPLHFLRSIVLKLRTVPLGTALNLKNSPSELSWRRDGVCPALVERAGTPPISGENTPGFTVTVQEYLAHEKNAPP